MAGIPASGAALWTIAVAQPLFDLLGRSPEFFVAHDTRPGDLLGLVILLCLAGPACWLPALWIGRLSGPRSHALAIGVAVGALAALFVLAAVKQAADWNRDVSFAVAAIGGVLFASMYIRVVTVRLFATLLSPAVVVAPALFLAQPGIRPLLAGGEGGPAPLRTVAPDRPQPVVVVVFDQLPLISLLDRDGGVDRALYPSFAALADEATWFRNASAVSGWTASALPAILTGNYPRPGRLPTADHHPANLFTLLGPHYALHVAEPLTDLCPETLCPLERDGALAGYGRVLTDLAIVYLHAALPDDVAADLPPVTQNWRDFAPADNLFGRWNTRRDRDRGRTATDFIGEIGAAADGGPPPLHFLHLLLPHEPWVHLPTGQTVHTASPGRRGRPRPLDGRRLGRHPRVPAAPAPGTVRRHAARQAAAAPARGGALRRRVARRDRRPRRQPAARPAVSAPHGGYVRGPRGGAPAGQAAGPAPGACLDGQRRDHRHPADRRRRDRTATAAANGWVERLLRGPGGTPREDDVPLQRARSAARAGRSGRGRCRRRFPQARSLRVRRSGAAPSGRSRRHRGPSDRRAAGGTAGRVRGDHRGIQPAARRRSGRGIPAGPHHRRRHRPRPLAPRAAPGGLHQRGSGGGHPYVSVRGVRTRHAVGRDHRSATPGRRSQRTPRLRHPRGREWEGDAGRSPGRRRAPLSAGPAARTGGADSTASPRPASCPRSPPGTATCAGPPARRVCRPRSIPGPRPPRSPSAC